MDENSINNDYASKNKTGVLIINLGTPDAYDYFSIQKYLREFLSDRRVIELNPILWQLILNLFILPVRPFFIKKKYQLIWFEKESPLTFYTKSQAKKLQQLVNKNHQNIIVDYAMRYGNPSIESKTNQLMEQGCQKIIFIPLYPQYCSATTASVCDKIYQVLAKIRWQPEIRIVGQYYNDEVYIKALVNSIKRHIKTLEFKPDAVLSSYHGIPQEYSDKGDPYEFFCNQTNQLLTEKLAKIKITNHFSFQSRFGPKQWLQPYTSDVLKQLVDSGVKNLVMLTPGFSADCIETLEEVKMEYKEVFLDLGGEKFSFVPCLNDSKASIKLINHLLEQNLW